MLKMQVVVSLAVLLQIGALKSMGGAEVCLHISNGPEAVEAGSLQLLRLHFLCNYRCQKVVGSLYQCRLRRGQNRFFESEESISGKILIEHGSLPMQGGEGFFFLVVWYHMYTCVCVNYASQTFKYKIKISVLLGRLCVCIYMVRDLYIFKHGWFSVFSIAVKPLGTHVGHAQSSLTVVPSSGKCACCVFLPIWQILPYKLRHTHTHLPPCISLYLHIHIVWKAQSPPVQV